MTRDPPSNPALEDAVRREPANPDVIAVYADWLTEQGSPFGELIALRDPAAWEACGLPGVDRISVVWNYGIWDTLRVHARSLDASEPDPSALAELDPVFAAPTCVALRELDLMRWTREHDHQEMPILVGLAGTRAWAAHLAELVIGELSPDETHAIGELGPAITHAFPRLRRLVLRGGLPNYITNAFGFDGLQLAHLDTLELEVVASRVDRRIDLEACRLPALTTLVLRGAAIGPVIPALLRGSPFQAVRHLGLRGLAVDVALDAILPNLAIAEALETLDLAGSSLTGVGARALARHRGVFASLATLDVRSTSLAGYDVEALRTAFPHVTVRR